MEVLERQVAGLEERHRDERFGRLARTLVPGEGEDDLFAQRDRLELAVRVALSALRIGHVHAPFAARTEIGLEVHHPEGFGPPPATHVIAIFPEPPDEAERRPKLAGDEELVVPRLRLS